MSEIGLTHVQRNLLTYIEGYAAIHDGASPSYQEMMEAMGLHSKSNIHRIVKRLEERGFVRRLPNKKRSIALLSSRKSPGVFIDLDEDQLFRLRDLAHRRGESPSSVVRSLVIARLRAAA